MRHTGLARIETDGGVAAFDALLGWLATATGFDAVIDLLRLGMRPATGADGIAVVLREGDLVSYRAEDAIGPLWTGLSFPIHTCITGHAILDDATIVVPDILGDRRIPQVAYRPTFVRSLVTAPVGSPDPWASLGAYWARVGDPAPRAVAAVEAIARAIPAIARPPSPSTHASRAG